MAFQMNKFRKRFDSAGSNRSTPTPFMTPKSSNGYIDETSAVMQRLKKLFQDINQFLAFSLNKIAPARCEANIQRADCLISKLDNYTNDDDVMDQFDKNTVEQIRDFRTKLELRANKLAQMNGKNKSGKQSSDVTLPKFSGDPSCFPMFLVAIRDIVLPDKSLDARAKYRKIFFALNQDDQRKLAKVIFPDSPNLSEVIQLLKDNYEAKVALHGYINVYEPLNIKDSGDTDEETYITDDESYEK